MQKAPRNRLSRRSERFFSCFYPGVKRPIPDPSGVQQPIINKRKNTFYPIYSPSLSPPYSQRPLPGAAGYDRPATSPPGSDLSPRRSALSRPAKSKKRRLREQRRARTERRALHPSQPAPTKPEARSAADPVYDLEPRRLNSDLRWYIARTLPRMGDRAIQALKVAEVDMFQPRTSEVVVRRGRRVVRHAQLLMRTVFIGVRDAPHLDEARNAVGVAEIVSRPEPDTGPPGNITGMVMRPVRLDPEALQRFVDAVVTGEIVAPLSVAEGSSVIVQAGPFASFPGTVEAILPGDRLKVAVSIFGRVTPVEVGLADVAIV